MTFSGFSIFLLLLPLLLLLALLLLLLNSHHLMVTSQNWKKVNSFFDPLADGSLFCFLFLFSVFLFCFPLLFRSSIS